MSRVSFLKEINRRWWVKEALKLTGVGMFVALLFYDDLKFVFLTIPYLAYVFYRDIRNYEYRLKLRQMDDFLNLINCISGALQSGYALERAFEYAVEEIEKNESDNTLISNLKIMMNMINCGAEVEVALTTLSRNINIEEVKQLPDILALGKKYGGNTIVILKQYCKTLMDKQSADREINTMIAAKRLEGKIMQIMPFGIVAYMELTNKAQMRVLYSGALGRAFMSICLVVIIIMGIITDKIIDKCSLLK